MTETQEEFVRPEDRRQQLLEASDRYVAELLAEVGEPSSEEIARNIARSLSRRTEPA